MYTLYYGQMHNPKEQIEDGSLHQLHYFPHPIPTKMSNPMRQQKQMECSFDYKKKKKKYKEECYSSLHCCPPLLERRQGQPSNHPKKLLCLGLQSQGQSNLSAFFNCPCVYLSRDGEKRFGAPLMLDEGTCSAIVVHPSLHCCQGVKCMLCANRQCLLIA